MIYQARTALSIAPFASAFAVASALAVTFAFAVAATASAQTADELQPLWQQITTHQEAGQSEQAIDVADQIVEALLPKATDWTHGIELNLAYLSRASMKFDVGRYAEVEADLRSGVQQASAIEPPPGIPAQALPQIMSIAHGQERKCLRALADFYLASSDFERATNAFHQAQAIRPYWQTADQNNPTMAYAVLASDISSMEGSFYRRVGDYERAAEAFLDGLKTFEDAWKKASTMDDQLPQVLEGLRMNFLRGQSNFLIELAELASLLGKHREAIGFADRAKKSTLELQTLYKKWAKAQKANAWMKPETIQHTLDGSNTLANYLIYERTAKILRAAGEQKRALELVSMGNIKRGNNFRQLRQLARESGVIRPEESLRLEGDLRTALGETEQATASYNLALEAIKANYPDNHPSRLDVFESLAIMNSVSGDKTKAREFAERVFAGRMRSLADVLSFADEPTRLAYRSSIDPWSIFASLRLPDQLCLSILRTKGVVLDSILEDRKAAQNTTDPKLKQTLMRLNTLKRQLMEWMLGGASKTSDGINDLRTEIRQLETQIRSDSRSDSRAALSITVEAVANAIPKNAALIEFIRFSDFQMPGHGKDRYGAVVLNEKGSPVFQPLGNAVEVDAAMESYSQLVREITDDGEMTKVLTELRKLVWEPLTPHLPDAGAKLILAPDGVLNFLSFATLLEENGTFLSEKYPIAYVTSGRDLVRGIKSSTKNTMTILANPDFNKPGSKRQQAPARNRSGAIGMRGLLSTIGLPPLPGTDLEASQIQKIVDEQWEWPIQVLEGGDATEAATNRLAGPTILHFATHGFFLPRTGRVDSFTRSRPYWDNAMRPFDVRGTTSVISNVTLENPMHRSGIALAGAQDTLEKWGESLVGDTTNDGILTAEEIAMLDLNGTWLVVLSACEAGLGEARSGEGVLGLRRGLLQAGAENLLFTLWPVADRETVLFMRDFYAELDGARNEPAEAAHKIQTKYLRKFREEIGVAAAVRLAGPFILSYQK